MDSLALEEQRRVALAEIEADLTAWRRQHPQATLQEIEQELDARLAHVRAQWLGDLAQASTAADWRSAPPPDRPVCPDCGTPMRPRGTHTRQVKTQGNHIVTFERQYGICPAYGTGFFPLDEQLALLPGGLTVKSQALLPPTIIKLAGYCTPCSLVTGLFSCSFIAVRFTSSCDIGVAWDLVIVASFAR